VHTQENLNDDMFSFNNVG